MDNLKKKEYIMNDILWLYYEKGRECIVNESLDMKLGGQDEMRNLMWGCIMN